MTWLAMAVILFVGYGAIRRAYPQISMFADSKAIAAQQIQSAKIALQRRQPDQAIELLQEAIEEQPRAAEPRCLMGEAYLMQRKPDPAIDAFQEALKLDPEYAEAAAGLGTAYLAKGMKAEAEEAFKKAAELGYTGN
jgi:cytochrome c-type biogenesis protein CcmH/NrfG